MPEGPELHLASRFINQVCNGRIFGKIVKSEISKNPAVTAPSKHFAISSTSRGKEIKVSLHECQEIRNKVKVETRVNVKRLDILVTFGLAGKFEFVKPEDLAKHAHLNFYTVDKGPDMVLSFVDYMRFGRWTPGLDFSYKDRGPCVLTDYTAFREHVLKNIDSSAFNKPICELLLNQKYFNGIGNYLRAEILFRAGIPPFVSGRSVLETLAENPTVKSEKPDILELCHILPQQVIALESSWYDDTDRENSRNAFNVWLQCYYQDGMKNMADHNKRTIWYTGAAGPLVPKDQIVRGKKKGKSQKEGVRGKKKSQVKEVQDDHVTETEDKKPVKRKTVKNSSNETVKKRKIKLEKSDNEIDIECKEEVEKGPTYFSDKDLLVVQELSKNMHGTRMTRRKLKDILDQNAILNGKVKLECAENGGGDDSGKIVKSSRKVLNNDAPYLNSAKQNSRKRRK